jgi:hypothetical protein
MLVAARGSLSEWIDKDQALVFVEARLIVRTDGSPLPCSNLALELRRLAMWVLWDALQRVSLQKKAVLPLLNGLGAHRFRSSLHK